MRVTLNVEDLLKRNRIEYVTRGKNVKRGHLNIQCPFCGSADPSHHMGIDPGTAEWACWRNAEHRGKSPVRLLMKLLHVGYGEARELCGLGEDYIDPDGFSAFMHKLRTPVVAAAPRHLELPAHFEPITGATVRTRRHFQYLCGPDRCFEPTDVPHVVSQYNLCASIDTQWRDRVLMPYYEDAQLVAWTGRAISRATLRYKDLGLDDCVVPIKHTFYNAPALNRKARALLVHEGPFDVVKADFYGKRVGIRSVGLSTASMSDQQLYRLTTHAQNFEWIGVCMDQDTGLDRLHTAKMVAKLAHLKTPVRSIVLPEHWQSKDFGGATAIEATHFLMELSQ